MSEGGGEGLRIRRFDEDEDYDGLRECVIGLQDQLRDEQGPHRLVIDADVTIP